TSGPSKRTAVARCAPAATSQTSTEPVTDALARRQPSGEKARSTGVRLGLSRARTRLVSRSQEQQPCAALPFVGRSASRTGGQQLVVGRNRQHGLPADGMSDGYLPQSSNRSVGQIAQGGGSAANRGGCTQRQSQPAGEADNCLCCRGYAPGVYHGRGFQRQR
ncbi:MAG: hypothetical protein ACI9WU_002159, partial [Myxococcota bacterium]